MRFSLIMLVCAYLTHSLYGSVILPDYYINSTLVNNLTASLSGLIGDKNDTDTKVDGYYVETALRYALAMSDNEGLQKNAAILLYTTASSCSRLVNGALRSLNGTIINPWVPYLKLLHTALDRLCPVTKKVCRGDTRHLYMSHVVNSTVYLPSLSYSYNPAICDVFADFGKNNCTILWINAKSARDVWRYSIFGIGEEEFMMLPGTKVKILSIQHQKGNMCRTIEVEEILPQPLHLANVSNLGDNISSSKHERYDDFIRNYENIANQTVLNATSLTVNVIGGYGNPFAAWPFILSVMNGQVYVTGTQLIGALLIGINNNPTRGLTNKELKALVANATKTAGGKWIKVYYIQPQN